MQTVMPVRAITDGVEHGAFGGKATHASANDGTLVKDVD